MFRHWHLCDAPDWLALTEYGPAGVRAAERRVDDRRHADRRRANGISRGGPERRSGLDRRSGRDRRSVLRLA